MEDIFRPLKVLWRPGKCGDHARWVQKAAQGCLSVSAGWSVWRKQNVQLKAMMWLFLLKDVQLCRSSAPLAKVSIAQRHSRLGRFLCSTSLQNFISSHRGGGWKSVRWGYVLPPSLVHTKGLSVPAMKGQKKMGSTSGAVSPHATAPGQPLQGHLLCSCLRCCLMWSVQPSLLTHCFPPGLPFFP